MALTTTAPVIDASGISAPSYADVLVYLQDRFRAIYGQDVYLEPDSQDGQLLAVFAACITDANAAAIQVYNAFSPVTAAGEGLSRNVKINGLARARASYSMVDLTLIGAAGTTIAQGYATDAQGTRWRLPTPVVIPPQGMIEVTAVCEQAGDFAAAAGAINRIGTPTRGWQSVVNPRPATVGAPVESDARLRVRQGRSVALPSLTVLEGIVGAVASLHGVRRCVAYENDSNDTDAHGLPPHSIALVVDGGDASEIAAAIVRKKTPGTATFGGTSVTVPDPYGRPMVIRFLRPAPAPITVALSIKALSGYSTAIGVALQQAVADYVNDLPIGAGASGSVEWADAITAANSVPGNATFRIGALTLAGPAGAGSPDVALAFDQAASCAPADVVLTVA